MISKRRDTSIQNVIKRMQKSVYLGVTFVRRHSFGWRLSGILFGSKPWRNEMISGEIQNVIVCMAISIFNYYYYSN
jgi:hypothetical protein